PNLMLMCYPHQRETNDVEKYTVTDLRRMKHERQFSRPDRSMREKAARLSRASLVGAGVIAGGSIAVVVQQMRSAFDALIYPSKEPSPEYRTLRKDIEQGLR